MFLPAGARVACYKPPAVSPLTLLCRLRVQCLEGCEQARPTMYLLCMMNDWPLLLHIKFGRQAYCNRVIGHPCSTPTALHGLTIAQQCDLHPEVQGTIFSSSAYP